MNASDWVARLRTLSADALKLTSGQREAHSAALATLADEIARMPAEAKFAMRMALDADAWQARPTKAARRE